MRQTNIFTRNIMMNNSSVTNDIESGVQLVDTIIPSTLVYSPFIPHNQDTENRFGVLIDDMTDIKLNIINLHVRLNTIDEKIEKLKKEFYETIKYRLCDCCINIVLLIVIYIKVFVGFS
jgi:hypothetical protein